eukprot:7173611-Prymnesium_polylepis.1
MASTLLRSADGMYPDAEGVASLVALTEPNNKTYAASTATSPTTSSVGVGAAPNTPPRVREERKQALTEKKEQADKARRGREAYACVVSHV